MKKIIIISIIAAFVLLFIGLASIRKTREVVLPERSSTDQNKTEPETETETTAELETTEEPETTIEPETATGPEITTELESETTMEPESKTTTETELETTTEPETTTESATTADPDPEKETESETEPKPISTEMNSEEAPSVVRYSRIFPLPSYLPFAEDTLAEMIRSDVPALENQTVISVLAMPNSSESSFDLEVSDDLSTSDGMPTSESETTTIAAVEPENTTKPVTTEPSIEEAEYSDAPVIIYSEEITNSNLIFMTEDD